jgi:large subunit ribosomal protein L32e
MADAEPVKKEKTLAKPVVKNTETKKPVEKKTAEKKPTKSKTTTTTKKPEVKKTTPKTEEKPKTTTDKSVEKKTETKKPVETKKQTPKKEEKKAEEEETVEETKEYKAKKKPELSKELKEQLQKRKQIKKRTPNFIREEWFRYKRIPHNWRRPDGITSKMRKNLKYRPSKVRIGFRGPRDARGLHPSGFEEILVYNVNDIGKINPKTQAARIGGTVGTKKRIEIEKKAEELDIRILNM